MTTEKDLTDLLDDPGFGDLHRRVGRFNLFETLGAVHREIEHSNVLAFLLRPDEAHGLGSGPLRRVLRAALSAMPATKRTISPLAIALGPLSGARVHRELESMDLVIEADDPDLVLVIENKINAPEGQDQLARYRKRAKERYPERPLLLAFLTPDGREAEGEEAEHWAPLSYRTVIEALERCTPGDEVSRSEGQILLSHYIAMLRRHVVEDDDLASLARDLYAKHKAALDYIFAKRPDQDFMLEPFRAWLGERNAEYVLDKDQKSVVKFVPKRWTERPVINQVPKAALWWSGGSNLVFEIRSARDAENGTVSLSVALVLGYAPEHVAAHLHEWARAHPVFSSTTKQRGANTTRLHSRTILGAKDYKKHADNPDSRADLAMKAWNDFAANELPVLVTSMEEAAEGLTTPGQP